MCVIYNMYEVTEGMTHICKSEDSFLEGIPSFHLTMSSRDGSRIASSTQQASLPTESAHQAPENYFFKDTPYLLPSHNQASVRNI